MAPRHVEAARDLLSEARIQEPPVPVEHLARLRDARIEYEPFDGDISGMLFRDDSRRIIGVNSAHSRNRQRFTIAHEIGHLLLHTGRHLIVDKTIRLQTPARVNLRDRTSSLATDKEEIEANGFAAELLMPEEMIRRAATKLLRENTTIGDEKLVLELARLFRVSTQPVEIRLATLRMMSMYALQA